MSEFVTNMFQYDVTVGITRSEVIGAFSIDSNFKQPAHQVDALRLAIGADTFSQDQLATQKLPLPPRRMQHSWVRYGSLWIIMVHCGASCV